MTKRYKMLIVPKRGQMYSTGCLAATPELAKRNPGYLIASGDLISLVEIDPETREEIVVEMESTPGEWGVK